MHVICVQASLTFGFQYIASLLKYVQIKQGHNASLHGKALRPAGLGFGGQWLKCKQLPLLVLR